MPPSRAVILLDTDILSLLLGTVPPPALTARLDAANREVATTIVSVEESMRGWLARIAAARTATARVNAYRRFFGCLRDLQRVPTVGFDAAAEHLYSELRGAGVRIGTMDLRIACIALAIDATLATRNLRDFRQVPGLRCEDWTV